MGTMKFDVPHNLPKDEVKKRIDLLLKYWGGKYGVKSAWQGEQDAKVDGKVMGISLDAKFKITDSGVEGEGTDPGMLLRGKAKSYLQEKLATALDPAKSLSDVEKKLA
jgi:hypothetical protein